MHYQPAIASTKILLVEEDQDVREMLREYLSSAGALVDVTQDADAAIAQMLRHEPYDVMLSDVRMRGTMDGWGLARWVRRERPLCLIFLMTGSYDQPEDAKLLVDAFLMKPFRLTELREIVARCVQARSATAR